MTLTKSLLLGSAASLSVVTGVYAADLPSRKSAPVEYVRICDAYGAGFFYIPGTDTCIKVGGLAYGEIRALTQSYQLGSSNPGSTGYANGTAKTAAGYTGGSFTNATARDTTGYSALGRVELDARTASNWGTVRSFIRLDAYYGSGANASTGSNFSYSPGFDTGQGTQGSRETTIVNKAFIQFAGLTAGRAQSVFDFYADAYNYAGLRGSNATVELLSYTYTFGGGFSATVSVEDNNSRRTAIGSTIAGVPTGTLVGNTVTTAASTGSYLALPQGNRLPEFVGNVRYDTAWGAVQISGAIHQIDAGLYGAAAAPAAGTAAANSPNLTGNFASLSSRDIGGAVQLGVMYNADFISPGDKAWVQAAYESGAYAYIAGNNLASSYGPVNGNRFAGDAFTTMDNSVFWNTNPGYDCVFTGSGVCEKQWGWDVTAAYKHYWTPNISSAVYGSHLETYYTSNAYNGISGFGSTTNSVGVVAPKETRVGANIVWTPIKGFDIGLEGMWIHASQNTPVGLASNATLNAAGLPSFKNTEDEGEFRARVQRAF